MPVCITRWRRRRSARGGRPTPGGRRRGKAGYGAASRAVVSEDVAHDFYAGAIAAFVVILFAKFLAHRTRRPEFRSKDNEDIAWWIGHWICVIAAWLGLLLSLAVLAFPAFKDHDNGARWVTCSAAAIAVTI